MGARIYKQLVEKKSGKARDLGLTWAGGSAIIGAIVQEVHYYGGTTMSVYLIVSAHTDRHGRFTEPLQYYTGSDGDYWSPSSSMAQEYYSKAAAEANVAGMDYAEVHIIKRDKPQAARAAAKALRLFG